MAGEGACLPPHSQGSMVFSYCQHVPHSGRAAAWSGVLATLSQYLEPPPPMPNSPNQISLPLHTSSRGGQGVRACAWAHEEEWRACVWGGVVLWLQGGIKAIQPTPAPRAPAHDAQCMLLPTLLMQSLTQWTEALDLRSSLISSLTLCSSFMHALYLADLHAFPRLHTMPALLLTQGRCGMGAARCARSAHFAAGPLA